MEKKPTNLKLIPTKSMLLLLFKKNGEMGTIEATDKVVEAEGMKPTLRWKWVIRFYMMEMEINGMLVNVGYDIAPADYDGQENVVVGRYKITKLGIERIDAVVTE